MVIATPKPVAGQAFKCTDAKIHRYTGAQLHGYTGTHVHTLILSTSVENCKFVLVLFSLLTLQLPFESHQV